ncbi:MAG: SMI1/KNR4 family protein, partial [Caulobacteraceae bacterium]
MKISLSVDEFADLLGGPGASEAEITAFEAAVDAAVPDDYRGFLGRTRGANVPSSIDVYKGEDGEYGEYIAQIGGLGSNISLMGELERPRWGRLTEGLVWIGKGRGGDPIALSLLPDQFGRVYLVDHEVMPGADTDEGAVATPME